MSQDWMGEGLRFECTQCGNCCAISGYVWMTETDISRAACGLQLSLQDFGMAYLTNVSGRMALRNTPEGRCTMLDSENKCSIYPNRPTQCRTWPFWPQNLVDEAAWQGVRESCPGAGCGQLHSREDITALLRAPPV